QMARGDMPTPEHPEQLIFPAADAPAAQVGVEALAPGATVCSCNNVDKATICGAVCDGGARDLAAIKAATRAGTTCGGRVPLVTDLLKAELRRAGESVDPSLCEHFAYSRQELFEIIRVDRVVSFSQLLADHGSGQGCEICKPAVASMLASRGGG